MSARGLTLVYEIPKIHPEVEQTLLERNISLQVWSLASSCIGEGSGKVTSRVVQQILNVLFQLVEEVP